MYNHKWPARLVLVVGAEVEYIWKAHCWENWGIGFDSDWVAFQKDFQK